MKLYIFTPNKDTLFTTEHILKLENIFEVVFCTDVKSISDYTDFVLDTSEKIVALDPDLFDWKFTKEDIHTFQNVKAIVLQTTSFSWIDVVCAKEKGIPVMNLRGFSAESVAEYAFMLALGVARKIPLIVQDGYIENFVKHQGIELKRKTAGIIGLGRIGSNIADITNGFGMNTIYWSKNTRDEKYEYKELLELIKTSDVIFLALAQNEDTEKLLTDEMISSMKKSAIFISIVHNIYNHDLVIKMVQEGNLYGYGYEMSKGGPSLLQGNIYALPPLAWATKESMETNANMWVDAMILAGKGEYPTQIN
jgi:glycerate dehydrogenase